MGHTYHSLAGLSRLPLLRLIRGGRGVNCELNALQLHDLDVAEVAGHDDGLVGEGVSPELARGHRSDWLGGVYCDGVLLEVGREVCLADSHHVEGINPLAHELLQLLLTNLLHEVIPALQGPTSRQPWPWPPGLELIGLIPHGTPVELALEDLEEEG
jgi:hypothetical protein